MVSSPIEPAEAAGSPVRATLLHYPRYVSTYSRLVRSLLATQEPTLVYLEDGPCTGCRYVIEEKLRRTCDFDATDWLLTVGGTWPAQGPSPEDIVPLATASVLERPLPGVIETLRARAVQLHPRAMLDCGVAGIRGATFLLNLPADPDLIAIYLQTLSPVAAELLQLLRGGETAEGAGRPASEPAPKSAALQEREFAAFLNRRRPTESESAARGRRALPP